MTAYLVEALPEGQEWIYEVKLDGYRAMVLKTDGHVQIRSRNDKTLTAAYPGVVAAMERLKVKSVLLDGEIVALDSEGRPFSKPSSIEARIRPMSSSSTPLMSCTSMVRI